MAEFADLIKLLASPVSLLLAVAVFGVMPGVVLRLLVLMYPKGHVRRRELIAELYDLGRLERLLFVGEQLETAVFEGLGQRVSEFRERGKAKPPDQKENDEKHEPERPHIVDVRPSQTSSMLDTEELLGYFSAGAPEQLRSAWAPERLRASPTRRTGGRAPAGVLWRVEKRKDAEPERLMVVARTNAAQLNEIAAEAKLNQAYVAYPAAERGPLGVDRRSLLNDAATRPFDHPAADLLPSVRSRQIRPRPTVLLPQAGSRAASVDLAQPRPRDSPSWRLPERRTPADH